MFEPIGDLMPKQLKRNSIYAAAQAARICFEAKTLYGHLFEPISFKNGVLTISCGNNIEAQNIQFKSQEIIKKINLKIGLQMIERIKFRVNCHSER
ncbi:hypothetical protein A3F08_00220 [Candidatus Berkelbacteria bacterium RIFCSPHIGHO2_12_FULL_36_9]|uniref:DUF721 domain-containing protein n=1 Tax=Candidatus Berkelbacteria bacterium RIFCSPHIGHO2_12_FULL_36_9 TaxID=1797469 RepID=A0A1F5EGM9_9BACT|nr:MAG: hypothetical protein A3F08_00220 [Candidatus Berkelbacteria bacterium RIFCSPHIGHO2_12_FULL_36_9]